MKKRSTNPRIPIHVTLKSSTINRLDSVLKYNQSRSKWIDAAIVEKLEALDMIDQINTQTLLTELLLRGVIRQEMYILLKESISVDA